MENIAENNNFPFFLHTGSGENFTLRPTYDAYGQLIEVHGGSGRLRLGIDVFDVTAGDVFYLPPETVVEAAGDGFFSLRRAVFDPDSILSDVEEFDNELLQIFAVCHRYTARHYPAGDRVAEALSQCMEKFCDEWQAKDFCYKLMLKATVYEVMATILRDFVTSRYLRDRTTYKNILRLRPAVEYADAHYREKVYIRELAALTGVSEDHFEKVFRIALGRTPLEYVCFIRHSRALLRLIATTDSVTAISRDTGFSGSTFFSNRFCDLMGVMPREYRKSGSLCTKTDEKVEKS